MDLDSTAIPAYDPMHDGKAHSTPALFPAAGEKGFEYLVDLVRGDTATRVGHN
jgi:hypothetical protein